MMKLKGACEMFQVNLNYHSAGELGIATAAYLHLAAATPALPHALDTHATELAGDVVAKGVIGLTERGTMRVPEGPGLGVALDPRSLRRRRRCPCPWWRQERLRRGRGAGGNHSGQIHVLRWDVIAQSKSSAIAVQRDAYRSVYDTGLTRSARVNPIRGLWLTSPRPPQTSAGDARWGRDVAGPPGVRLSRSPCGDRNRSRETPGRGRT